MPVTDKAANPFRLVLNANMVNPQDTRKYRKDTGHGHQLPSLDHRNGSDSGGSFRVSSHRPLPEIPNYPVNTLLPELKDGLTHPKPFYVSPPIVVELDDKRQPWAEVGKGAGLKDVWNKKEELREAFVDEFIKDALYQEVHGICSAAATEGLARHESEKKLFAWLEENVVTDEAMRLTEELAWECLWDNSRKLKKEEVKDLESLYRKREPDPGMLSTLRNNYTSPMSAETGQSLLNYSYGELLYHSYRLMQRGSLMENYAIRKLQEQIITRVAAKVILDEAMKFMEEEMATLDEEERVDAPPREG